MRERDALSQALRAQPVCRGTGQRAASRAGGLSSASAMAQGTGESSDCPVGPASGANRCEQVKAAPWWEKRAFERLSGGRKAIDARFVPGQDWVS